MTLQMYEIIYKKQHQTTLFDGRVYFNNQILLLYLRNTLLYHKLTILTYMTELERLKEENERWSELFAVIASNRNKATDFEKEANLRDALAVYKHNIEFAINNGFKYWHYAHDINRVVILLGKLKEHAELSATLSYLIDKYPNVQDTQNWRARLAKLYKGSINYSIDIAIGDIGIIKPSSPTVGQKIRNAKAKLPEFNFYFDMPSGMETFQYLTFRPVLNPEITREFLGLRATVKAFIQEANIAEKAGDYLTAIRCYEKLIIEECEEVEPYNRLIVIYGKLKWTAKVKETLLKGISFFSNLSQEQKEYILNIAAKYGMTHKATEYINSNKPIYYYAGLFQLYNSYSTVLEKWNSKLRKLNCY